MSEPIDDSKAITKNPANLVHINVTSQDFEDIIFKVKKNTKFKKIMDKYCDKFNIQNKDSIKFIFDGENIKNDDTPENLQIEDGDVVEAVTQQVGGILKMNVK